jgi:hypothetical protein
MTRLMSPRIVVMFNVMMFNVVWVLCITIKDCFHTLHAKSRRGEGPESVETISCAEPLGGGWGYGDWRFRGLERMDQGWGILGSGTGAGRVETGFERGIGASLDGKR